LPLILYVNLSWLVLISVSNTYSISRTSTYFKVISATVRILAGHMLLVFVYYVFQQPNENSREVFIILYTIFSLILLLYKTIFFIVVKWARRNGFNYRNIVIISSKEGTKEIIHYLNTHPEYGYNIIDNFNVNEIDNDSFQITLSEFCKTNEIHEIFYSITNIKQDLLSKLMAFAEINLIKIRLIADFKGLAFKGLEVENYGSIPIVKMLTTPLDDWEKQVFKRGFDFVFSVLIIVFILSWLLPILAIIIKLDSKGPVFFKQQRTGRDNKTFLCYKLRSMHLNKDSDTIQATKNDIRITKVGRFFRKTSLDELPQFFNVLIGDMSIVGPRPHMLKHTEDFTAEINSFMLRHHIKPGITGLAQLKGYRGEISDFNLLQNRVKFDLDYIKNWSFWLDIQIIIRTIVTLFQNNQP
jgi:putative colanic acid biosynthesis UDP-glucose lipid carrier transferase